MGGLVVVLNGDVLTDADIGAMLASTPSAAPAPRSISSPCPIPRPMAWSSSRATAASGASSRNPTPSQITTNTINAGFYVIDRALIARMPAGRVVSIEREFFPGLLADAVPFFGWVDDHYWLDIGSPAKYRQGQHRLVDGYAPGAHCPGARRARGRARMRPVAS